jgi:dTDP-glucose 4,6-dehydratase
MYTHLVTGGAGFIGSNFILCERRRGETRIINLDLLTYAGNLMNLESLSEDPGYAFVRRGIGEREFVRTVLEKYRPSAIVNFAAESHVDRSIDGPEDFVQTNVVGTFHLLEEVRRY